MVKRAKNPIPRHLISEWDYDANDLGPEHYSAGSDKKVWWVCSTCTFSFEATVSHRVQGTGCSICSGKKVIAGYNDLASKNPALAKEWDLDLNDRSPDTVTTATNVSYFWRCALDHGFKTSPNNRAKGTGCPYCANSRLLSGFNDLATRFPEISRDWDTDLNGKPASQVMCGGNTPASWKCRACGYMWKETVGNRTQRQRPCANCSGKRHRSLEVLADRSEAYAFEFREDLNDIERQQVRTAGNKQWWWECRTCSYVWKAPIARRMSGSGCARCAGHYPMPGQSFADIYPALAKYWDWQRNVLEPSEVSRASGKIVAFRCPEFGHAYSDSIANHVRRGACKICLAEARSTKKASGASSVNKGKSKTSSLPIPLTVMEGWHWARNSAIDHSQLSAGSSQLVWWTCVKGHEYQQSVRYRCQRRARCSMCSSHSLLSGTNDLATTHPQALQRWDFNANVEISPFEVKATSHEYAQWSCTLGHSYQRKIRDEADASTCIVCTGRDVQSGVNDVASQLPSLLAEWDTERNSALPKDVYFKSATKFFWKCSAHGHSWQASPSRRGAGLSSCETCSGKTVLAGFNDLATLIPELALHHFSGPDGENSSQVYYRTTTDQQWQCALKHEPWVASIKTRLKGHGCPVCAGQRPERGVTDLRTLRPSLTAEWAPNQDKAPEDVGISSTYEALWLCTTGKHTFRAVVSNRARLGTGCGYCAKKILLEGFNDFASQNPDLMREWDWNENSKRGVDPTKIMSGSPDKAHWVCQKYGHQWAAAMSSRIHARVGCPKCKQPKTEGRWAALLNSLRADSKDGATNRLSAPGFNFRNYLQLDMSVPLSGRTLLVIEYDGAYYHQPEAQVEKDRRVTEYLLTQGHVVARIRERTKQYSLPSLYFDSLNYLEIDWDIKRNRKDSEVKVALMRILAWAHVRALSQD